MVVDSSPACAQVHSSRSAGLRLAASSPLGLLDTSTLDFAPARECIRSTDKAHQFGLHIGSCALISDKGCTEAGQNKFASRCASHVDNRARGEKLEAKDKPAEKIGCATRLQFAASGKIITQPQQQQ